MTILLPARLHVSAILFLHLFSPALCGHSSWFVLDMRMLPAGYYTGVLFITITWFLWTGRQDHSFYDLMNDAGGSGFFLCSTLGSQNMSLSYDGGSLQPVLPAAAPTACWYALHYRRLHLLRCCWRGRPLGVNVSLFKQHGSAWCLDVFWCCAPFDCHYLPFHILLYLTRSPRGTRVALRGCRAL